jgi:hypothetical protein
MMVVVAVGLAMSCTSKLPKEAVKAAAHDCGGRYDAGSNSFYDCLRNRGVNPDNDCLDSTFDVCRSEGGLANIQAATSRVKAEVAALKREQAERLAKKKQSRRHHEARGDARGDDAHRLRIEAGSTSPAAPESGLQRGRNPRGLRLPQGWMWA